MINNIKLWLSKFKYDRDPKIKTNFGCAMDIVSVEDSRQSEAKKAVEAMFRAQHARMEATRMITHAPDCPNVMNCTRTPCFTWLPDRMSDVTIIKKKSKKQRTQELIDWANRDRGFGTKSEIDTHHKGMTADQLIKNP